MQNVAQKVRSKTIAYLQLALAESLWLKRLVLQRTPEGMWRESPDSYSIQEWWRYTLLRLGNHLNLPEEPRIVAAFRKFRPSNEKGERVDLDDYLQEARRRDVAFHDARVARMERLIKLFSEFNEGAFGGWRANPILRAVLIPGAGVGAWNSCRG